ncbi:MAG TPA: metal-dependent hydrolase [Burkholderiaceae bacterium]|nr:metal-dependent hydrolase [Burkholderiaceae bacterium]
MDVFTHAVLGAKVAHAAASDRARLQTRERLLLGSVAAAFPDIDFAGFLVNPLVFLADWHQGPTHSLVLLPLWAVLIGGLFSALADRRSAFAEAVLVSGLALASHIASDLITAYGTAVLYPLSDLRLSLGTTFVIDPFFTGIVLAGLAASLWTGRRLVAGIGLAVLCLYVGAQAALQQRAIEIGRASAHAQGLAIERLSALAQPLSPFNWKLLGVKDALHYEAYLNVAGHRPLVLLPLSGPQSLIELAETYRPPAQLSWQVRHRFGERPELRALVEQLWEEPRFAPFRRFATYPSLSRIDLSSRETCVWFTDLRYDLPVLPNTFRYGFCRDSVEQPWQLYRLRYFSEQSRQRLSP